jgi:hypothetical protein
VDDVVVVVDDVTGSCDVHSWSPEVGRNRSADEETL